MFNLYKYGTCLWDATGIGAQTTQSQHPQSENSGKGVHEETALDSWWPSKQTFREDHADWNDVDADSCFASPPSPTTRGEGVGSVVWEQPQSAEPDDQANRDPGVWLLEPWGGWSETSQGWASRRYETVQFTSGHLGEYSVSSVQSLSCVRLFVSPMDCSTPGFPVHHQLPELAQTHVYWVGNTIQPFHPLSSPSPPTFNLSQHWGLF